MPSFMGSCFGGVVVVFFRAFADPARGPVDAVGEDVADPVPVRDLLQQVKKTVPAVLRQAGHVPVGQNAGLVKLECEGDRLRGRVGVQAVLLRHPEDLVAEIEPLEGRHVIGVFAEALVPESFPAGVFDHVAALLGAVVAARLPVQVIVFQPAPSVLERFAPEILAPDPRVAPGKMVVVEAVVFVHRHPVPAPFACRDPGVHPCAQFEKLGRSGDMHVPRPADGDGLQALVAHDDADAAGGARVTVIDGRHVDTVLTGRPDGGDLHLVVFQLPFYERSGFGAPLPPQMGGVADLHPVVADRQVDQIRGPAAHDNLVVAGMFHLRPEKPAHQ